MAKASTSKRGKSAGRGRKGGLSPSARKVAEEALDRAESGCSEENDATVEELFEALGYDNIVPRVTVLTYHAWRAKGRQVRKGEHGVQIKTWIPTKRPKLDAQGRPVVDENGRPRMVLRPKMTTVFHRDQTDPIA